MKILLISSYLPYPLFSGGHIRLYNLIRELSKKHKITLICEKRLYQTKKDEEEVGKFCKEVITVGKRKQWTLENILRAGFWIYPFLMVGHTNEDLKTKITRELSEEKFDLIHVETFYVMQNLPRTQMRDLPIVLADQNIEYMVYKRFANQVNLILRPLLDIDILKMKFWEEKFWRKANYVVVTSKNEKREVEKFNRNVMVVPNGVDLRKYQVSSIKYEVSKKEKTILFIGDFKWIENRDAAHWLLQEIWPMLKSKVKRWAEPSSFGAQKSKVGLKLWVVGKNIPDSIKRLGNETIVFDENAPNDTSEIFKRADILIAPIRVGGGGKFKILEAMASGVPVVTTTIGIEGIEAKDGDEVLIGDSTQGLVNKTIEVLTNQDLYEKLAREARLLIEEKYDWRHIVRHLEDAYNSVLKTVNV